MFYNKTTGSGPQIIFVHGNSQNHSVWDAVIADAALAGFTCIAPDLPGHGRSFRSEYPEKDYNLRAMAQHLVNFCNQYSAGGYVLVSSSLAGNLIAEHAGLLNNCKGVFLTGACLIGENIMPDEIIQPNPNFPATFATTATDAEINALMNDEAYVITAELRDKLKAMYHDTDPNLRAVLGTSIANQDYGDEIGNLWKQEHLIALIYGAEDKIIYPDYMQNRSLKLWKDKIIKIPKAGHCPQFDEPALLAGMVSEFAAECFK